MRGSHRISGNVTDLLKRNCGLVMTRIFAREYMVMSDIQMDCYELLLWVAISASRQICPPQRRGITSVSLTYSQNIIEVFFLYNVVDCVIFLCVWFIRLVTCSGHA